MARRTQTRQVLRRPRQWIISSIQSASFGSGTTQILHDLTSDFDTEMEKQAANLTALAIRGNLGIYAGASATTNPGQMAVGVAWIPEGLVTAGELPNPLTDDYDWMYHFGAPVGVIPARAGFRGEGADPYVHFDQGGSRKQRENHSKLVVIGFQNTTSTFTKIGVARTLYAD